MRITEYAIERSQDALIARRTVGWNLTGLVGVAFPVAGLVFAWQGMYAEQPQDWVDILMLLAVSAFMAYIFYRLLIWGRLLVFDKISNQFLINGHRECALSDLTSVRLDITYRSPLSPQRGTFITLHLMMAQGRDIVIKSVLKGSRDHEDLKYLGEAIADFTGAKRSMTEDEGTDR
jgi:hypothetical protein